MRLLRMVVAPTALLRVSGLLQLPTLLHLVPFLSAKEADNWGHYFDVIERRQKGGNFERGGVFIRWTSRQIVFHLHH